MGADTTELQGLAEVSKCHTVAPADTDFKLICSFEFLQIQRWVSGILQEERKLLINSGAYICREPPVILQKGICSPNLHCEDP
jgi:hypothetical protein